MADFLRGLLRQPDRQTIAGLLQQPTPSPLQGAMQAPQYVGGALRDPSFYADVGSRLADLLRSGVRDVLPTGTRTQKLADMLGAQVDPNYMQKMTDVGLAGMTVFHGSPYKFDKFDMSKIGTGEGAQAYGHGLYFAESPQVAREYQEKLSNAVPAQRLIQEYGDADKAISAAMEKVDHYKNLIASGGGGDMRRAQGMLNISAGQLDALKEIKAGGSAKGNMYRVDLPDEHIAKMLDWDKPLSQQSEAVQKAIQNTAPDMWEFKNSITGKELYSKLTNAQGWDAAGGSASVGQAMAPVSAALRQAGIPGIRYLDGGSRTGGAGTSNFVVFDDQLPKIIGRE